ncbi:GNAT family N-acetyltransferase [Actinoplanes sp. NPDC051851]|uniref:GNAT family N-acetyltransferase n=1 Tax=Actinoplanes sp. NPDC051851 TaxID=3154753 RepID=UPI00342A706D
MTTLQTERLALRQWRDDDLDALAAMNADPEVMRYIMDGAVRDRPQTEAGLRHMVKIWEEHAFGLFAIDVRETGEFAGWAGLSVPEFLPEVMPTVEIGWRLAREHWGQGYATEAATAALRFGFEERGLERVVSIRHRENDRSRRVMEKLGMAHGFDTVVPANGQPVAVHAISRDQYLGGGAGES